MPPVANHGLDTILRQIRHPLGDNRGGARDGGIFALERRLGHVSTDAQAV